MAADPHTWTRMAAYDQQRRRRGQSTWIAAVERWACRCGAWREARHRGGKPPRMVIIEAAAALQKIRLSWQDPARGCGPAPEEPTCPT